ncbi:hypothetical protein QVD17_24249 [Tagetes erecta]|uniref:Reverse transcriptase domain-containing protein n=1 Tax=Tagetes erecta TaxID=13708 RepID=A0AAD8KEY7_TARER|nr:hypothetical protein QVD17_24249 [Tagetes erecta]
MPDTWINTTMARELQKLKDMISSVPGVVRPIPEIPVGSHKISRFAPPICDAEIPKRFQTPNMKLYYGSSNPEEHVAQYRERMEINPILKKLKEACLCKDFGSTLTGSTLKWVLSVPPYSITSFAHLVNLFNNQFSCSRSFERLTSDLYRITQSNSESLRDYVSKFGMEVLEIPNLDMATTVQAFKMGLKKDSPFYDDLVMTPCSNLDEDLGEKARWPRKTDKAVGYKDKSKWCSYHEDFGHITDECIALRREIGYLLSKGHFKDLFGRKKQRIQDPKKVPEKATQPPPDAGVINFISRGSDIYGTSYSAAKMNAKEWKLECGERPVATSTTTTQKFISFDEEDRVMDTQDEGSTLNVSPMREIAITLGSSENKQRPTKKLPKEVERSGEQDVKEILLEPEDPESKLFIGSGIQTDIEQDLISFLKRRKSTFTWKHEDMIGISKDIITYKLGVDPSFRPIHQKRRKFAPERNVVIQEEVDRLLRAGMIREVKYPKWLANVVIVKKKIGKWRVCVDFTDLSKACPKDLFPSPHIDSMVDAAAGHELLTFMDASSGFQQIQMKPSDQEDTTFMTPTGIYCYIAMPFGLRNAGATYQRLVSMMFKDQLGDIMEVYIDDMVVKSERKEDHLQDLEVAFNILDKYNMKLNPSKCHFGVKSGKFLGYVVTKRGIEASPEQIKAINNLKSPRNMKDVQRLTGRVRNEKHEAVLKDLKDYLSSAPALMKPVKDESLIHYLAVSGNAVSAVLVKDHEGQQHPVYYISKSLLDAEAMYSHIEKLILALIMTSTKLRHYFETNTIVVKTNYPIKNVLRKPELSGRMAKWAVKLSTYDIKYEPRNAIKSQALADFVADFTCDLQVQADLEVQQLEETKDTWILYTDGASNVRGTGLGILLKSPQRDIIPQSIACEFQATNNEAEYEALIARLQLAQHMKIQYLQYNTGTKKRKCRGRLSSKFSIIIEDSQRFEDSYYSYPSSSY